MSKNKNLKILFVASEAGPFAKVGGLGEVMFSLPRSLRRLGHDARVMIPRYLSVDQEKFNLKTVMEGLKVPTGGEYEPLVCNVKMFDSVEADGNSPAPTYFLENEEYYEKRANVYGYSDDSIRWALLCRGALEFVKASEWKPDIIVASDWQTGLIPNYLHTTYKEDPDLKNIAVLFSIHNIGFQASFDHHFITEMDYDSGQAEIPSIYDPKFLKLNFMRRGVMYADVINTVSPTYAQEITTPEYGEMLQDLLSERRGILYGILNGIDYEEWNPATDDNLNFKFNHKALGERDKNKSVLQRKFNLPEDEHAFLIGIVSRLVDQKGFDMLMTCGDSLLNNFNIQLIVIGTGDGKYITFFEELRKKHPNKLGIHLSFDAILPRLLYGGADAILIPSKYEPCGLTQMEAMRYGAVPIVRKTGGLADSVQDFDLEKNTGDGFVFENYDNYALLGTIIRAMEINKHKVIWKKMQERAMKKDFSWDRSAGEYAKILNRAIESHIKKIEG
ncbi:MAG: hypothetical protein A2735_03180 [Candidatus Yanofskybacteria bacterium RIFCSPHIGHO2_01_FULL_41_21]|uniref:Glycogen synthase n=1 Tax=Candidatus Yanofskybacteria bacterium RIFCSPHIGHO2_01_FULL_41_21 TaxID=1802660 RepID=A0A1F8E8Z9_9BACT|nr:MAG: hypothetical protein A2735_03180 [Candidatus Yanofskybacteria bacterium RIFCSPHIGHO2_01_FULL_41_21]